MNIIYQTTMKLMILRENRIYNSIHLPISGQASPDGRQALPVGGYALPVGGYALPVGRQVLRSQYDFNTFKSIEPAKIALEECNQALSKNL